MINNVKNSMVLHNV